MMAEGQTLYKLIILYMLRKVNFPLSNTQLMSFLTEHDYTDYFHVQEALSELVEAKLVTMEKIRNTSQYTETMDGERTLEYFVGDIPLAIRREIDQYLKDNSFELRNENCTIADYEPTGDGGYAVHCIVTEGKETVIELTINVTSEEEAERVCSRWPDKSQEIYMNVMNTLL